ncbi:MAG: hypothetical protein DRH12_00350 [Deltaproteobacteria bacterium]|nr:MAG: hypothetical protein DRH12_00350 [Deltaproteobacteria bacterium]
MKRETLKKAMRDSISEILETMFFMPSEYSEEKDISGVINPPDVAVVSARLTYTGRLTGTFFVVVPVPLAEELTGNLLGVNTGVVEQEEIGATVKELLNMVAGKTFSLYDSKSVFELGVPELIEVETVLSGKSDEHRKQVVAVFDTIKNPLGFKITIDDGS